MSPSFSAKYAQEGKILAKMFQDYKIVIYVGTHLNLFCIRAHLLNCLFLVARPTQFFENFQLKKNNLDVLKYSFAHCFFLPKIGLYCNIYETFQCFQLYTNNQNFLFEFKHPHLPMRVRLDTEHRHRYGHTHARTHARTHTHTHTHTLSTHTKHTH